MEKESAWEKFKKSGRVLDYISYRSNPGLRPENNFNTENSNYPGAQYENICKWSNYPRDGLR